MCVDLTSSRKEINVNMMRYYMHNKPLVFFPFFKSLFLLLFFCFCIWFFFSLLFFWVCYFLKIIVNLFVLFTLFFYFFHFWCFFVCVFEFIFF
jgi:hypothetical protein